MTGTFTDSAERCSDLSDEASKTEELVREHDISLARAKAAPEQAQVADPQGLMYWPITECVSCDDTIPIGRLALAKIRCIACQEKLEKRNRQHV